MHLFNQDISVTRKKKPKLYFKKEKMILNSSKYFCMWFLKSILCACYIRGKSTFILT